MKNNYCLYAVLSVFLLSAASCQKFDVEWTDEADTIEYVDLGLTSGTLWATCNIGASSPENAGDYFAWGETTGYKKGKTNFSWSNYKYCKGSSNSLTKYCSSSSYGTVDNKTELELSDDAAYVNWGEDWTIPSKTQQEELINECNWTWTTQNGVKGYRVSSKKNGNSIFFPASGSKEGTSSYDNDLYGVYWSRTLEKNDEAFYLGFNSKLCECAPYDRSSGRSIRPVKIQSQNQHKYVDLGLTSGTLWATMNVGASKPEDYGDYFAWGETTGYNSGKTNFNWSTYKWCNGSYTTLTKYCTSSIYGTVDYKTELELADDAAYVNWGSGWRMPSLAQINELISECNWTWTTRGGVYGRKVTSKKNGNSIFLPAAGSRDGSSLVNAGSYGDYWSRSLNGNLSNGAYYLYFYSSHFDRSGYHRYCGRSVRPVVSE